ncbi:MULTISPECIES: HisA/HisF-related TIM barrel protein [Methylomonas]|uniref:HisA/HisF-related TIM barrel protein n=1 Tax=Methylomonas TaxID=416 RepID=UPI001231FC4F|nr:HisA/HisF-related TIM barrel protein [Methylomonas rhizoryzae]
MQIIPVIDLKGGIVVHAVGGARNRYRPIHEHSQVTEQSDLTTVLSGLLSIYPFERIYMADLDAICGTGNQRTLVQWAVTNYPDIEFWLDDGCNIADLSSPAHNLLPVIGTESQLSPPQTAAREFILSLDYKNRQPQGHQAWFRQTEYWPQTVIAMTLHRVGKQTGPDFELLAELTNSHPQKSIVAAGGVRDCNDLETLQNLNISAVLLATALHNGNLSRRFFSTL